MSFDEDDDTEEGEEKPRTVMKTNGNGHSTAALNVPTTTLVGAKRRKCNLAHRINLEDKVSNRHKEENLRRSRATFLLFSLEW